jgi:hypothetical protein
MYIQINAAVITTAQVISFFKSEEGSIVHSSKCPNTFFFNLSAAFFRSNHIDCTNEIEGIKNDILRTTRQIRVTLRFIFLEN